MNSGSQDFFVWHNQAVESVEHLDASLALKLLNMFERGMVSVSTDINSQELKTYIDDLKIDLRYTAFPVLDLTEAVKIVNSEIMKLISRGIHLDDRLSVRYAFTTYGEHGKEQQALRKAILSNQELVGGKAIGTWLQEFDKAYNPETRDNRHVYEFLSNNRQLAERDRAILNLILTAYENWIATERLTMVDIAYLNQHPELLTQTGSSSTQSGPYASQAANVAYQAGRTTSPSQGKGVVHLPLLKALSEYPRLGEQQITTEKIRVKSSPELVRPSLANWIRYYRDELGIGFHDQVTRGKFLFQSENGKKLGNDERERINLVLKSLEEDFPLDIDTDRMMIVFPVATPPMVPQGRGLQGQSQPGSRTMTQPSKLSFPTPPQAAPARPVKPFVPNDNQPFDQAQGRQPITHNPSPISNHAPKTAFFGAKFGAAKNVAGETLHFSTGHVLPSEKSGAPSTSPPANLPTSAPSVVATPSFRSAGISQSRGTALPRSPYSIRPLRMRDDPAEREMESR